MKFFYVYYEQKTAYRILMSLLFVKFLFVPFETHIVNSQPYLKSFRMIFSIRFKLSLFNTQFYCKGLIDWLKLIEFFISIIELIVIISDHISRLILYNSIYF